MYRALPVRLGAMVGLLLMAASGLAAAQAPTAQPYMIADADVRAMWVTPDNTRVVYVAWRDDQDAIWSVPATGGRSTRLSLPVPQGTAIRVYDVQITLDSRHVAYLGQHAGDGAPQLYSVPITGGTPVRLNHALSGTEHVASYELSSAGTSIVFVVDADYSGARRTLWSVPLSGGAPVRLNPLLEGEQRVTLFRLSRDGTRVVFIVDDGVSGAAPTGTVYSVPIGGGTPTPLGETLGSDATNMLMITPDSRRVVYGRQLGFFDNMELWIAPIGGGEAAKIVSSGDRRIDHFWQISPDSAYLVYRLSGLNDTNAVLYSASLQPGPPPIALSDPALNSGLGTTTPDGNRVIYTSERAGGPWYSLENDLRSVPITGGPSLSIRPDGAESIEAHIHLAPNSSRILLQDVATDQLFSVPPDGTTAAVALTPTLPYAASIPLYDMRFSQDGSRVFYRISPGGAEYLFDLRMQSASGGEPVSLRGDLSTVGGIHLNDTDFSVTISPDETFVVFRGADTNLGPRSLYRVDLPPGPAAPTPSAPGQQPGPSPSTPLPYRRWLPAAAR